MSDLALFPVPEDIDSTKLEELNAKYISTRTSFGTDASSNLVTVGRSSTKNCIQRVLKLLLTEKGSVPSNTTYGTNLIRLCKYGYNPQTINEDIVVILLDAETQCKKQDVSAGLPLGSQLGSIDLIDIVLLDTSQLKLSIGIKTAAGITGSFEVQV